MMSWGQIQELNMQLSGINWSPTVTLLALNETKELEHRRRLAKSATCITQPIL